MYVSFHEITNEIKGIINKWISCLRSKIVCVTDTSPVVVFILSWVIFLKNKFAIMVRSYRFLSFRRE